MYQKVVLRIENKWYIHGIHFMFVFHVLHTATLRSVLEESRTVLGGKCITFNWPQVKFFYFLLFSNKCPRENLHKKIFYILSKCTCICGSSDSMYKITHNVSESMYDISVYILSKKCIRYSSRRCMLDILYWYRSRPSVFFEGMGGIPR